jgi:hypothetical protein
MTLAHHQQSIHAGARALAGYQMPSICRAPSSLCMRAGDSQCGTEPPGIILTQAPYIALRDTHPVSKDGTPCPAQAGACGAALERLSWR